MQSAPDGLLRPHQPLISLLYRISDGVIIALVNFYLCEQLQLGTDDKVILSIAFLVGLFWIVAESVDLYRSWRLTHFRTQLAMLTGTWTVAISILFVINQLHYANNEVLFILYASGLVALVSWRWLIRSTLQFFRRRDFNSRSALIVGLNESGLMLCSEFREHAELGMLFKGFYDDRAQARFVTDENLQGNFSDAIELAKQGKVDNIFISLPMRAEARCQLLLDQLADTTATVHIVPNFFMFNLLHSRWHKVGNSLTLSIHDTPFYGVNGWLKRLQDLVLSLFFITLLAIPMLLIALLIKLDSKGPVLFKQDRYGLDRKLIKVFKFRTMVVMENDNTITQAKINDPRVTRLGRFLRASSLDELPQLFNVLMGTMSLVGPRPHAIAHNEMYRKVIRGYMLRHKVKPGMTGWAQINGWRGETESLDKMENRVKHDLFYINRWSPWLDFKIILLTVFNGTLFNKKAY